jgi:hypothetical protein
MRTVSRGIDLIWGQQLLFRSDSDRAAFLAEYVIEDMWKPAMQPEITKKWYGKAEIRNVLLQLGGNPEVARAVIMDSKCTMAALPECEATMVRFSEALPHILDDERAMDQWGDCSSFVAGAAESTDG